MDSGEAVQSLHDDVVRRVKHDNRRFYTASEKRRLLQLVTSDTWLQHQYARTQEGKVCHPCSPEAARWDLIGACAYLELPSMPLYHRLAGWNPLLPPWLLESVVLWQDGVSWSETERFLNSLEVL